MPPAPLKGEAEKAGPGEDENLEVPPTAELPPPPGPDEGFELIPSRPRKPAGRERAVRGPSGLPVFIALIAGGVLATLVLTIMKTRLGKIDYTDFFFVLVVFTLCAYFNLKLKGGGAINMGIAPLLAALTVSSTVVKTSLPQGLHVFYPVEVVYMFLFGTIVTVVTTMVGDLKKEDLLGMGMDLIGVGIATLTFYLAVRLLPKKPDLLGRYSPAVLVAAGIAGLLFYLVFLVKSSFLLSKEGLFSPGVYFQSALRRSWPPFLMLGFSGVLMGLIFMGIGMWSVLFMLPLLAVILYAYNRLAVTDRYLLETIQVLSAIPEETGMVRKGHAQRVATLSVAVARELGLSPEDAQQVEYAAYLHDTGAIIKRAEALDEQRQLMEAEGVIAGGVDIVGRVGYLEVAAEILRGREGLRDRVDSVSKRRAVSLGAGIIRAVDDFESLVHGEEGREPLSEAEALTEMNLERGIRYDSKVLRAISRVLPRVPRTEGLSSGEDGSEEGRAFWAEPQD